MLIKSIKIPGEKAKDLNGIYLVNILVNIPKQYPPLFHHTSSGTEMNLTVYPFGPNITRAFGDPGCDHPSGPGFPYPVDRTLKDLGAERTEQICFRCLQN